MTKLNDFDKRKTDKPVTYYKCCKCFRLNSSYDTLMVNKKPECLFACKPDINNYKGWLFNETE